MVLITHILIAIIGILSATVLVAMPTKRKLHAYYVFATGTLVSGLILTVQHPSHLAQSCITGLIYFSFVGALIYVSQRRLSSVKSN